MKFTLLKEKPPKGHVVREEIDNNPNTKMVSKRDIASEKNSKTMSCWKVESHEIHEAASGILTIQSSQRSHVRKRIDFDDTLQFGAQVYSDATSDENSRCRSCRGQGMERARSKSQHGIWKKSREKRRFVWNHKETNITSSLLHWWTYFHFKTRSWNQKYWSTKGRVAFRWDIVKDDSGANSVFIEQGSSASQNDCRKKYWMLLKDYQVVTDKQGVCSICRYLCKIGGCSHVVKIPKSECLDVWVRLPRRKKAQNMGKTKIPWYFLNEICTDTHSQSFFFLGRQFDENLLELGCVIVPRSGMHVCSSTTSVILVGIRGWHQNGCKGAEYYGSRVEEIDQICRSWRIYNISWPWKFGMYSAWMQTEWNNCWTIHEDVWVT